MPQLSVQFMVDESTEEHPLRVSLYRPDTQARTLPTDYTPPLDDGALRNLRWYLEEYAAWPSGPDYDRAHALEAAFEDWGRKLLASVLIGEEAMRLWQQFLDAEGTRLLTIDATDPRVLQLPWELLADQGGHLFSRQISIRRRLQKVGKSAPSKSFDLPVRVLVVVSRPEGSGFIPPRAVSRPLLDALDKLGDRVVTEFLYPPTVAALNARLYDESAPPVHVVHFDGHGIYDRRRSLGYLVFEDNEHQPDLVDAERLGTLLNQCDVPLMVLNACQSARQEVRESDEQGEANPFASVAARLIYSGVNSVLAMNYSVLVVAAQKFVEAFYGSLAGGVTVGRAVDRARMALLADPKRHRLTRRTEEGRMVEEIIRLHDWFLPALYQQTDDPVVFAQEDGDVSPAVKTMPRALTDPAMSGGLPAEPPHGFHGRAREILQLERLLAERSIVVLYGMGGMGKTALSAEAGRWFYRTGRFPGGAAFVSFAHGGSLQQLCSWVGQAISGDTDFFPKADDPVQDVADLLAQKPALVILDNFESVLGANPIMPPDELKAVLNAVWRWAQAGARIGAFQTGTLGSRVLITTRSTKFNDARFEQGKHCAHMLLEGLDRDDALELAGSVLDDLGIDRERVPRDELVALMDHLGGHPLSLNLVLPHLRHHTPAALIERFEDLLPGFTSGAAKERHESLEVSLEFSLDRLDDETRSVLPSLAVFQGSCLEDALLHITEIDPVLWQAIREQLEAAGLMRAVPVPGVNPPLLQFHPTLLPYLATRLPPDRLVRLEDRYWRYYHGLAMYLYSSDSQHPYQARAVAIRELPNLRRAFRLAVQAVEHGDEEPVIAVDFADSIALFLNLFGHWRERITMLKELEKLDFTSAEGMTKAEYLMQSQRGEVLRQQGLIAEAEQVFRAMLAKMDTGMAYGGNEAQYDRALTMARLGRCLETQGRPTQAIQQHQAALAIFEQLSAEDKGAREMMGGLYSDLGDNLRMIGEYDRAEEVYKKGLAISREAGDHRTVGVTLGQLGTLALVRRNIAEARERYQEALETFRRMGEPQSEAVAWHQLGMVAQEEKDWDEAERCYKESLRLEEQLNHTRGVAETCNQLGIVARRAGRTADAERWYLRALEGFEKTRHASHAASVSNNLAALYLEEGRLDEARQFAERAAEIMVTLDLSAEPWKTYDILAQISDRQGRPQEVIQWRRKEQETFYQYAGAMHHMPRWAAPLIAAVVAAAHGNAAARQEVLGVLPEMASTSDWKKLAPAIQRVLDGERDVYALCDELDRIDSYIIRRMLGGISGERAVPEFDAAGAQGQPQSPGEDPIARIREQWNPVIRDIIAVCQGNTEPTGRLMPFLDQIGQRADWQQLVPVLRRILNGERNPDTLLPGLDPTDTVIIGDTLRGLGVDVPDPAAAQPEGASSLEQLLGMVAMAVQPGAPPALREQLQGLLNQMMTDPSAPEGVHVLGRALSDILNGERNPDLSRLPPELAGKVRAVIPAG